MLNLTDVAAIDRIEKNDLRFAWRDFADAPTLRHVLRSWAEDPSSKTFTLQAHALVKRLQRATQQSWPEEVSDIARALALRVYKTPAAQRRAAAVFAARYGTAKPGPKLCDISSAYNVSEARISQLLRPMLDEARRVPIAAPATAKLLDAIAARRHLLPDTIQSQLASDLGGASIGDALRFAEDVLGLKAPVALGQDSRHRGVALYVNGCQSAAVAARKLAEEFVQRHGAAHIDRIIGGVAAERQQLLTREMMIDIGQAIPALRWLGQGRTWLTIDELPASPFLSRIRRILAVADRQVTINEIAEAISTDTTLQRGALDDCGVLPLAILAEVIQGLSWVDRTPRGFKARQKLDIATELTRTEQLIYNSLKRRGNVAPATAILSDVTVHGVQLASARTILAVTPIARPVIFGVYALRGCGVDRARLIEAMIDRLDARLRNRADNPRDPRTVLLLRARR